MKIVFSDHAKKDKFPKLAEHNFHLTEEDVLEVVSNPDHEDKESREGITDEI